MPPCLRNELVKERITLIWYTLWLRFHENIYRFLYIELDIDKQNVNINLSENK